ncbi:hypothetical protein VUR80DRAFT_8410 [Thermomyces stellatus]
MPLFIGRAGGPVGTARPPGQLKAEGRKARRISAIELYQRRPPVGDARPALFSSWTKRLRSAEFDVIAERRGRAPSTRSLRLSMSAPLIGIRRVGPRAPFLLVGERFLLHCFFRGGSRS